MEYAKAKAVFNVALAEARGEIVEAQPEDLREIYKEQDKAIRLARRDACMALRADAMRRKSGLYKANRSHNKGNKKADFDNLNYLIFGLCTLVFILVHVVTIM